MTSKVWIRQVGQSFTCKLYWMLKSRQRKCSCIILDYHHIFQIITIYQNNEKGG